MAAPEATPPASRGARGSRVGERGCCHRLRCFPGRSGGVRAAGAAPESSLGPRPGLPAATGLPQGIPRRRARRPSSNTFRLMALRRHECTLPGELGLSLRPLCIKKGPVRCQRPSGPTAVLGSPGLSLGASPGKRKGPSQATRAGRAPGQLLHVCPDAGGRPSAPRAGGDLVISAHVCTGTLAGLLGPPPHSSRGLGTSIRSLRQTPGSGLALSSWHPGLSSALLGPPHQASGLRSRLQREKAIVVAGGSERGPCPGTRRSRRWPGPAHLQGFQAVTSPLGAPV